MSTVSPTIGGFQQPARFSLRNLRTSGWSIATWIPHAGPLIYGSYTNPMPTYPTQSRLSRSILLSYWVQYPPGEAKFADTPPTLPVQDTRYSSCVDVAGTTVIPPISASPNTNTQLLSIGFRSLCFGKPVTATAFPVRQYCTQPMKGIPEHSDFR